MPSLNEGLQREHRWKNLSTISNDNNKYTCVRTEIYTYRCARFILKKMQWTSSDINKGGVVEGCCGRGSPPVGWGPSSHCSNLWLSVLLCGHHCLAEIYHSCQWETSSNCHITQLKCQCDLALSGSLLPSLLLLAQMSSPCTIRIGTTTNKLNGCRVRVKQMSDRCVI